MNVTQEININELEHQVKDAIQNFLNGSEQRLILNLPPIPLITNIVAKLLVELEFVYDYDYIAHTRLLNQNANAIYTITHRGDEVFTIALGKYISLYRGDLEAVIEYNNKINEERPNENKRNRIT